MSRLTPLQRYLVGFRCALERAREELASGEFRAFVWIVADVIGEEAALLVVAEALEATEKDAAA